MTQYYTNNTPSPLSPCNTHKTKLARTKTLLSPLVTQPELYIQLNPRAMTLNSDLKRILDNFVNGDLVDKSITECILAIVATHNTTMIRATAVTLDPELHNGAT